MIATNVHPPLTYLPPGYTHLTPTDFKNDIFFVEECDLGWGMFARRAIAKEETILTFQGSLIDFAETKTKGQWECMPIQIGVNCYVDTLPPGVFVNHSCSPNTGIKRDADLVAMRTIATGEEIRFDYSTTMDESSFTMECRCGDDDCRHIIADFRTLPESKRAAYLRDEIVMRFILQKYLKQAVFP